MTTPHDFRFQSGQPDYLLSASIDVATLYGDAAGWPKDHTVPPDITEAVMNVETGGDIDNCGGHCPWQGADGSSAVWPMNVEPNGGEADYWSTTTKIPFSDTIPKNYPNDIYGNIEVGTLGLGHDYQDTATTANPTPSWYDVGMTYFTGDPNPDSARVKSDGFNTGQEYHDQLKQYIVQTYGAEADANLEAGKWFQPKTDGTWIDGIVIFGQGVLKNQVSSVAKDVLNGVMGFAGTYMPRFGIGLIGLAVFALGMYKVIT